MKLSPWVFSIFFILISCMSPYYQDYLTKLDTPLTNEELSLVIINETNLSKDETFDICLEWMAKTFVSSKAVIEYSDKSSGKIIGKGIIKMISDGSRKIGSFLPSEYHFTLSIEIKGNRYRLYYEDFKSGISKIPFTGLYVEEVKDLSNLKKELTILSNDLNNYINNSSNRNNW